MKCRGDDKVNDEAVGPGGINPPDHSTELLEIGSWTGSPQHPTGDLEITEANGD